MYLKKVQANFNPKVPRKCVKVELCADSVLPNWVICCADCVMWLRALEKEF